jgi:hypothetical protein
MVVRKKLEKLFRFLENSTRSIHVLDSGTLQCCGLNTGPLIPYQHTRPLPRAGYKGKCTLETMPRFGNFEVLRRGALATPLRHEGHSSRTCMPHQKPTNRKWPATGSNPL